MQSTRLHLVCPPAPASQAHFEGVAIGRLTRTRRDALAEGERGLMHFFRPSDGGAAARHSRPPFCFCNGARNFSDISRGRRGWEEQKSVTVHYAVIIFPPPSFPTPHSLPPLATAKRTFGKQTNATSVRLPSFSQRLSLPASLVFSPHIKGGNGERVHVCVCVWVGAEWGQRSCWGVK